MIIFSNLTFSHNEYCFQTHLLDTDIERLYNTGTI